MCPGGRSSNERDPRLVVSGRMGQKNLMGIGPSTKARIFRWALLVAFVACFLPVPSLPEVPPESDGERYPCQGSMCGCRSAYQCWTSCCCTTPEERLAWAIDNNVALPSFAVLASPPPQEPSTKSSSIANDSNNGNAHSDESPCPHCAKQAKQFTLIESESYCGTPRSETSKNSDCKSNSVNEIKTASHAPADGQDSLISESKPKRKPLKVRFVRVMDTLKCHGLAFTLDLINQCIIPDLNVVTKSVDLERTLIDTVPIPHPVYLLVSIPPPRVS